jgi:Toprim domain
LNDNLGLAIVEGIEDGLSVHEATGLGVWVAGAASRMPALAEMVPSYADAVSIIADADDAGRRHSTELAACLQARGIRPEIVALSDHVRAAA